VGTIGIFLTGLGVTFLVALAVVLYMRRHLLPLLIDICGSKQRADFWAAFCNVLLVLIPLIGAMMHIPDPAAAQAALFEISIQLRAALVGLVLALVVIGAVLSSFILRSSK